MFYPPACPGYSPAGYDPPFTPRYSVPESFRRALSYEGQIHWLAGLYGQFESMIEDNVNFWIVDSTEEFDRKVADGFLNTTQVFEVTWPVDNVINNVSSEPDRTVTRTDVTVKTGDVAAIRFTDPTDGGMCFLMGNLVEACRCTTPERWKVAVKIVVHDITARFDELSATVDMLETKVNGFDSRITTVETKVNGLENRVTVLEGDVTKLKTDVTELKGQVTDVTELTNRVTKCENDISALTTRVTKLETDVKNCVTVATFNQYKEKTDGTLSDIVNKFYGGGIIGVDGIVTWGDYNKAAVGNMNVYGGDSNYIKTRDGTVSSGKDNDVRVV